MATNSRHEILLELVKQEGYITCLPQSLNLSSADPEIRFFTLDKTCTSPNVLARNRHMALKPEGELFLNHMKMYTNGKTVRES